MSGVHQLGNKQPLYQVLSLDVVLGALAVGLFAIRVLNVTPQPVWWIILPLAVWSVYTLDHILDGIALKGQSTIFRHSFHYKNRKVLIPFVFAAAITSILLSLLYMEKPIIISGIILSVFVIIYFILVYFQEKLRIKYIHKEVFIAFVYVTGILLAPVVWYNEPLIYQHFLLFGILMLLVWTESVIISYYDFKEDKNDQLNSFTTTYGPERTRTIVISVQLILAVILFLSLLVCDVKVLLGAVIIESFMNFILLVIIYFHETFAKNNLFRWIGETVFMLPVLILFF